MPYHKLILAHRPAVLRVEVRDKLHDFFRLEQPAQHPTAIPFQTIVQNTKMDTGSCTAYWMQENERNLPAPRLEKAESITAHHLPCPHPIHLQTYRTNKKQPLSITTRVFR